MQPRAVSEAFLAGECDEPLVKILPRPDLRTSGTRDGDQGENDKGLRQNPAVRAGHHTISVCKRLQVIECPNLDGSGNATRYPCRPPCRRRHFR
jgi:hypothetical protein